MRAADGTATVRGGGFTLIEALVALVILSVGMLGIAVLYVEGLRAGRTAMYRSTAIILAADMADRIRANPRGGPAYQGTGPGGDFGCVNGPDDCTAAELAADDWFNWLNDLRGRLPDGAMAEVAFAPGDGPAPDTFTISLQWPEPGNPDPAGYALSLQL